MITFDTNQDFKCCYFSEGPITKAIGKEIFTKNNYLVHFLGIFHPGRLFHSGRLLGALEYTASPPENFKTHGPSD